jgi:hypothetical protein
MKLFFYLPLTSDVGEVAGQLETHGKSFQPVISSSFIEKKSPLHGRGSGLGWQRPQCLEWQYAR